MQAVCSSETSINVYQKYKAWLPRSDSHRGENLKSESCISQRLQTEIFVNHNIVLCPYKTELVHYTLAASHKNYTGPRTCLEAERILGRATRGHVQWTLSAGDITPERELRTIYEPRFQTLLVNVLSLVPIRDVICSSTVKHVNGNLDTHNNHST
jgi:hypothetical protein